MPAGPPLTPHVRRVVVLRALTGIGDQLCSLPALRSLRAGLPDAHIAVISVPGADAVLSRFPEYVDELIPFAGFPGIPEQRFVPADLPAFYQNMVDRKWDLAIQMQGNGLISNSLVALLGAGITAGYHLRGQYRPDPDWFMEYPLHLPEVRRHLALMEFLGFPSRGDQLEFPVTVEDRADLEKALDGGDSGARGTPGAGASLGQAMTYACIHPGATAGPRRWSPAGFAAVADALAAEGLTVVFTGQAFESGLVGRVRRLMKRHSIDLSGRTSVGALAALIEDAALVVCNDTGISHLAAALRVPSVVVFAGTRADGSDPLRWRPLDEDLHHIVCRRNGPTSVKTGGHPPGSCCLGDACASVVLPRDAAEAAEVRLSDVLDAVRAQLGRAVGSPPGETFQQRDTPRLLVAAAGAGVPAAVVEEVVAAVQVRWPQAQVEVLEGPEPWDRPEAEQWEWIARIANGRFHQAAIVGDGTQSPYALAYAFYLAGIARRSGVSAEFGGKLLTRRLKPRGPRRYPAPHELFEMDTGRSVDGAPTRAD